MDIDAIRALVSDYGAWIYALIFVWTFFEGETFVIFMGMAAHQGLLSWFWVFALAWSGSGIDASRHGQRFVAIQLGFGFALLVGGVAELAAGGNGLLGTPLVAVGWHRWLILAALASAIGGIPLGAWLTDAMQDAASDFAPAQIGRASCRERV